MKVKKWLLGLITFAAMVVICAVCAGAETYGDFEYSVLDDGTVEITDYNGSAKTVDIPEKIDRRRVTGIGDCAFENCTCIESITIPDRVTYIGDYTFRECISLTSITIPGRVKSIGKEAFLCCISLTSVTIPDSVTGIATGAFNGCTSIKSITIPNSVTEIGRYAFSGCTSLKSITIPDSVTKIGQAAFLYCTSLTSVTIPDSVTEIHTSAFRGCTSLTSITIPSAETSISSYAFCGCTSIKSVTIPDSVTVIGKRAFGNCTSLTNITIPDSVMSIGYEAFIGCTSLTSIKIPDSVTSISHDAFEDCTSLTSITIPDSVTEIGYSAFEGCTSLTSITIPDSVTSIDSSAFGGCTSLTAINVATGNKNYISVNGVLYNKDKTTIMRYPAGKKDENYKIPDGVTSIGDDTFEDCISLTSITIPDSVTGIGSSAFEGCTSLKSITIPDSVTEIGWYAFSGCTSLKSITIPDSVTGIATGAFNGCTSIKSITIPNSVTEIDWYAFSGCTSLKSITIPDSVTSIGGGAFEDCISLTNITIPNSVTDIGDSVFENCTSLKSITIPDSVTYIGGETFRGCTSLTAINVAEGNQDYASAKGVLYDKDKTAVICYPVGKKDKNYSILDSATHIYRYAFKGCTNLTSITIPDSVMEIGDSAFSSCTSLNSITIPDSVTEIGDSAFSGCTSLTSITIPDSVTGISSSAFEGCTSLKAITIPDSVVRMGDSAFEGCTSIKAITIPDSVVRMGDSVFRNCINLTSVSMSYNLTSIGSFAFANCENLKSIIIHKNVIYVGDYAFGFCGSYNYECVFEQYYDHESYWPIDFQFLIYNINITKYSNSKIYCYSGTAGEKYAKNNGFDYVLLDELPTLAKVTGAKLGGRAADALRINWTKNANADGYIVEMYQNGKWERVAKITNSNTTTYRKAGLKAGTVYKFRVKAYKMNDRTAVYSDYSATVTARTNPSVMTGAKLGGRAADALRINWTKNVSADGYIVEMYQGGKWVRVAKITSNSTTTFRKAGLKASTVYKFRVRAYKMSGKTALYGAYSATVAARTNPSVMTGTKLGGRAADALRINWSKNASADGYIIEMYQGNKWVRVAKITSNNTTTFKKSGLKASSVYKFRVSAYKMSGKTALYGNYSATVTARTNPSVMKGVKIGGKAKDALRVNWAKNASAQGYIVEMYKGGKWVRVAKITNSNTTTFRKAGLAKNTAYKFRVRAYHMSGKTALYGNYGSVSGKTAAK